MNNIEFAHNQQRAARIDDERSMIEAVDSLDNPFFELRTNEYGKGVYTKVVIKRGTLLKLFEPSHVDFNIPISMVPSMYRKYVAYVDAVHCNAPKDFEHMDIAWYINHADNPNVAPQGNHAYVATRDISIGEELFFDYNHLNEPEELKDSFYKK